MHICMAYELGRSSIFSDDCAVGQFVGRGACLGCQPSYRQSATGLAGAALNVRLVDRLARESRLTGVGQQILQDALDIEAKSFAIERRCLASSTTVRAKVSITAPPILARHFLAPHVAALARLHPLVQLSILSEPHVASLSRLEADLALRLALPIEDTDIIKKVGQMRFALYAGCDYPHAQDAEQWEFIGYTNRQADFAHKRWLYEVIGSKRLACELADLSHQYEAACTGIAVAGIPCFLGDADPRLTRLESSIPMLDLDIWVAMHPDSRGDPVVRHISQTIAQLLESAGLGLP